MATEKEILTCFFKGDSQRTIAAALRVSRNTVAKVVKACHEQQLEAAAVDCMDSETLHPSPLSGRCEPARTGSARL